MGEGEEWRGWGVPLNLTPPPYLPHGNMSFVMESGERGTLWLGSRAWGMGQGSGQQRRGEGLGGRDVILNQ